jgi:hypothetical protein
VAADKHRWQRHFTLGLAKTTGKTQDRHTFSKMTTMKQVNSSLGTIHRTFPATPVVG